MSRVPAAFFHAGRVSGRSGRNAYENSQKLEVLKYSRLKCSKGVVAHAKGVDTTVVCRAAYKVERVAVHVFFWSARYVYLASLCAAAAVFWFSDCFSGLLM